MRSREEGASLLEFAVVAPLLLVLVFGIVDLGFALLDWQAVSNATREGARVGTAMGTRDDADAVTVAAVREALGGVDHSAVDSIWVFKSNGNGDVLGPSTTNRYSADGSCLNGCPWTPASRNVSSLAGRDYLGVRVVFRHDWIIAGFLPAATWTDDTVMRMELEVGRS